ncbi:uncharacterized protein [Oscarella lobularis]|uniref:uncharacterized protein isoform X2 n=1 Tax=Oscarella lobularis TaxID=121494 RepID=UPI00331331D6
MADPCWKAHLQPVFAQVVRHMSELDLRDIADSMLTKSLLDVNEYKKLLGNLGSSQSKDAARIILITLMELPTPSFNTFCGILRDTGLDSAKAVLRLVEPVIKEPGNGKQTARDVSPPMTQMLAEQQQQQQENNEKQKQHPSVIQSKDKAAVIDFSAAPFNVAHRNGKPKPVQEEVDRKQCKDQSASAANVFQNNPLASQSPEVPRRPRSRSKLASKGVLLLCSSTPADEQYTSRLHKCLTECGVNAFFLESKERDHVIEIWGKQMTEEKDASLKRYSHCLPVITADFLQKGNCLQGLIEAMLNQANDRGMQILPLLVDTTLEEFKTKHPRLSTYAPFSCSSSSDLQSLANSIHKRLNASHRLSDDVSMSSVCKPVCKPGGLPGKSAFFCGRNTELHQILSECSSPILALCCITGPTGIGKSSLVAEVAHRVRDGDFPPGTSPSTKWNVLYLDARNLETELQFATEVLAKMKACLRDQLPKHAGSGASVETDKSVKVQLMEIVSNMLYPCIILDNCDQALKEENREGFLRFLRELTTAAKNYSMALITSCSEDVGVRFTLSGANVFHIRLRPLSDADSDNLFQQSCMHGSTPVSQPISSETIESIRSICEGIPMLIRLAGAVFRRYRESMTQDEIVHKLKKRPYKMFKEVSDMGFLSALYNLLPSHLQIFLHGLSLFTGSFTRQEGAVVFGRDPVTFAMEALSPLIDYNLVNRVSEEITGDEMQYYLHGLIRNFLQTIGCSEKQFRYFQENYFLLQLERIAALQIVYDKNPQLVTRQIRGFQVILDQLASLVKPTADSSKVWGQLLRLICNRNSFMKCSFSPELRKRLIKKCLSVCVSRHSAKSEPKIRLVLSDVLCDLGDLKRASSCLEKVFASLRNDAVTAKKMVQARYFLQKARLHTREGEGNKAISILTNEFQRDRIPLQAREHVECFIVLGDAYKSTGKYHDAIENFSQALNRFKECLGQESYKGSHPDTCNVLMNIGHCHFCIRQYDESLCSFSEAFSMHQCLASHSRSRQ